MFTFPIAPATAVNFFDEPTKKFAPGSPRNDDRHLGRPLASPHGVLFSHLRRHGRTLASLDLAVPVFIAPPPESSAWVRPISPRTTHQTLVPGDRLPWLAAEPLGHDSAESRAIDRHPRTTAAGDDAQSR